MSLHVVVDVNGYVIHDVHITNRGPVGGEYQLGDGPAGGGPRVYTWTDLVTEQGGEVVHERRHGAGPLVAAVVLGILPS